LNETLFSSLAHAREALSLWQDDYNTIRPHGGLGNLTPAAHADRSTPDTQRDGTPRRGAPRPVRLLAEPNGLKSTLDSVHRWMKKGLRSLRVYWMEWTRPRDREVHAGLDEYGTGSARF